MKIFLKAVSLLVLSLCFANCTANNKTISNMANKKIMEVTTFNINSDVDPMAFAKRDMQVESDFTSKQPGFIKRQSGVNDKGEYVVIVYWNKKSDADASMNKFMSDASVADYAKMINGPSMKMARFAMDKPFNADDSRFVEVMSFKVKNGADMAKFNALNQRVETDFTGKRKGFLQRLTGVNEEGKQVVAVYWASKETSDASLKPFMSAPIAGEFMGEMDQSTIVMGRYKFLNMNLTKKEKVVALLNSFNTGDQAPIAYINPEK